MHFRFKSKNLEALYTEEKDAHKYPGIVDDFFEVMTIIASAKDERDLYAQKGLRYERLRGKQGKQGQRSLRLNDQWRLIVVLEQDHQGAYLLIISIEDYH